MFKLNYTEKDFQKELRETTDALYQKAKSFGLFPDKTEEEKQKEYEDAQRVERATKKYMEAFKEIPEMNERMSYFADNGITFIVNPNAENHFFTENSISLAVSNEDPDLLEMNEVDTIVTVIDKLISADKFYLEMIDSYNNHPLKECEYLDLLSRYAIIKYLNKPHHGYVEEKAVAELMTAMMLHTIERFDKTEKVETQIAANEVSNPNPSDGNCKFGTVLKDDMSIGADFCLRMQDDSMIGLGIKPGDLVLFKEHMDIKNGDVVAVLIDGKYHLKTICIKDDLIVLNAENPAYQPMFYHKGDDIKVCGKLVMLQHKFEDADLEVEISV